MYHPRTDSSTARPGTIRETQTGIIIEDNGNSGLVTHDHTRRTMERDRDWWSVRAMDSLCEFASIASDNLCRPPLWTPTRFLDGKSRSGVFSRNQLVTTCQGGNRFRPGRNLSTTRHAVTRSSHVNTPYRGGTCRERGGVHSGG